MEREAPKAMSYRDGSIAKVGDSVLIENGQVLATIKQFIQTADELKEWGVEEPGVMFESAPFGLLFISERLLADEPLERA